MSSVEPSDLEALERTALEAAHAAGRVLRRRFRDGAGIRVETKGLHDYVTEVDREAEDAVLSVIRSRYPSHAVTAEEGSPSVTSDGPRWLVDPLDGTTNFIHGVATFCTSVAIQDEEGLAAGAIHDPTRDETFHARRGAGAFLDGRPIRCRGTSSLDTALIATGFPFREIENLHGYLVAFEAFVRSTSGMRRAGSAALDLAYTACGRYDGFWEIGLSSWDMAAGGLIVREAGGIVTDILGGDDFLGHGDVVAAGPAIHAAMLDITRGAFRSIRRRRPAPRPTDGA